MGRVDAHCHFWDPRRGDYHWLTDGPASLEPLRRVFSPADLAALNGGGEVVAVQAAASVAETRYLLDLAARHPQILAVVGWVDLADPASAATLGDLAGDPRFRGVRPMLQDLPEDDWITRRASAEALRAVVELGLCFDALVKPRHLSVLLDFARAWPDLPIVIDHCAKPEFDAEGKVPPDWLGAMARLADRDGMHCKISGLLTELPGDLRRPERAVRALRPVVDRLLDLFGPSRLIWGSDWPVLTLAGDHAGWLAVTEELLTGLDAAERADVLGRNARRFYGLGGGT